MDVDRLVKTYSFDSWWFELFPSLVTGFKNKIEEVECDLEAGNNLYPSHPTGQRITGHRMKDPVLGLAPNRKQHPKLL